MSVQITLPSDWVTLGQIAMFRILVEIEKLLSLQRQSGNKKGDITAKIYKLTVALKLLYNEVPEDILFKKPTHLFVWRNEDIFKCGGIGMICALTTDLPSALVMALLQCELNPGIFPFQPTEIIDLNNPYTKPQVWAVF